WKLKFATTEWVCRMNPGQPGSVCVRCASAPRNSGASVALNALRARRAARACSRVCHCQLSTTMHEPPEADTALERVRVLIADDHPLFRDGLRMLLSATDDLKVVGEARSGDEAVLLATTEAAPP